MRKLDVKPHLLNYKVDSMEIVEHKLSNDKEDEFCRFINKRLEGNL